MIVDLFRLLTQLRQSYGKIIISERYLPVTQKTIKPTSLGGIAGGEKYICQNILYKFAVDTDISDNSTPMWMYGGREKSDRLAAKGAAHDLSIFFFFFFFSFLFFLIFIVIFFGCDE